MFIILGAIFELQKAAEQHIADIFSSAKQIAKVQKRRYVENEDFKQATKKMFTDKCKYLEDQSTDLNDNKRCQ